MIKVKQLLKFIYDNFAPLIVFLAVEHLADLKTAIIACVVFSVADLIFRRVKKLQITRLYLFSVVVSLVFGVIDLNATEPFIFKYESVATNLLSAGFFGMTLFRGKPMIQELAESALPPEKLKEPNVLKYLRILTIVWTLYFVAKAGVYAVVSYHLSIDEAMAVRSTVGTASIVVLLGGEKFARPKLIQICKRVGWLT